MLLPAAVVERVYDKYGKYRCFKTGHNCSIILKGSQLFLFQKLIDRQSIQSKKSNTVFRETVLIYETSSLKNQFEIQYQSTSIF